VAALNEQLRAKFLCKSYESTHFRGKILRVIITISEPWDLGESIQWHPITGELLQFIDDGQGGRMLIKLDRPIKYRKSEWQYVVGAPRHCGDRVESLWAGTGILSALTGITGERAMSDNPLDTSDLRGGFAFIGDVEPASALNA
jgi:hypothetical protein